MTRQVHQRCPYCGRLLAPIDGRMPVHRVPPRKLYGRKAVPLTGKDARWCEGGGPR